jgi:hypothetical protein
MSLTVKPSLRRDALRGDDSGIAMLMVVAIIMIMTLLVTTAIAYAMAVKTQAKRDQDWNAALAAAGAGIDDFVSRVNKSDSYVQAVDCTNLAWKGPKAGTNTCGWSASTAAGWLNVQAGLAKGGQFHYDVDTSSFFKDGSVRLNSTGKVNGVSRTLQVRLARGGPVDFVYSTDFEDADPANTYVYPSGASVNCGGSGTTLAKYWYQTRSGCQEITFVGGDVLDGPVHFNDTPLLSSGSGSSHPIFSQGYETADPGCPTTGAATSGNPPVGTSAGSGKCWRSSSSSAPQFGAGTTAVGVGIRSMVDTSDQFSTFPGCVYTGDTRIRFNSDGTMTVWNTKSSGTTLTGPNSPSGTNCGNAAAFVPASGQKYPSAGQTVPVPNDMVIYVKNSASSTTCVPGQIVNGTTSGSTSNDQIPVGSGSASTGVTDVSFFNPSSITTVSTAAFKHTTVWSAAATPAPTGPTETPTGDTHPVTFDCGSGNVYVEGTLNARVTLAAQNNVIITGNLLMNGTAAGNVAVGTPMLGLVAANSVVVYHPQSRGFSTPTTNVTAVKTPSSGTGTCSSTIGALPTGSATATSMTCTWTTTKTFNSTYSDLAYPSASTGSSFHRWIYASIQTLQHSFWVGNYNAGSFQGTLSVRGSIAQRWRGIVGTGGSSGTGYLKDYSYDTRLKFSAPPYFPQWNNAVWGAKTTGELKPQY